MARLYAKKKFVPGAQIRGHVGGKFVSGTFAGFERLHYAKVDQPDGPSVLVGAAAAAALLQEDRAEEQATVPAANVAAALGAAKASMAPDKKKKLIPAAIAAAVLAAAASKWPYYAWLLYPFGLSVYLGKMIVPRVLTIAVAVVALFAGGPVGSQASQVFGLGFLISALLGSLPAGPGAGPGAVCTALDLKAKQAKVAWRASASASAALDVAEAAGGPAGVPAAYAKKAAASVVVAVLLSGLCARFMEAVEAVCGLTTGNLGLRMAIFFAGAGASLRLPLGDAIAAGYRAALPPRVAAALVAPAGVCQWFLQVNFRAAAAGAAVGLLLPMRGPIQTLLYRKEVIHQIHWFDTWLHTLSYAVLVTVVAVQASIEQEMGDGQDGWMAAVTRGETFARLRERPSCTSSSLSRFAPFEETRASFSHMLSSIPDFPSLVFRLPIYIYIYIYYMYIYI